MSLKNEFSTVVTTVTNITAVKLEDFYTLREKSTEIASWGDEIVALFYDTLYANEQTKKVFREGERPQREKTLSAWIGKLFEVEDLNAYWDTQRIIAFVHVRRNIKNEFMVSASSRLQEYFWQKSVATFGVEEGLKIGAAFARIINTVVGLTVALYDLIITDLTGASPALINNLIECSIDELQTDFLS